MNGIDDALDKKVRHAIAGYLNGMSYHVLNEDFRGYMVARDDTTLLVVEIQAQRGEMPVENASTDARLARFEDTAVRYIKGHDVRNCKIEFANISAAVTTGSSALIRAHMGIYGGNDD